MPLHVSLEEGGRGRFHLSVYPREAWRQKTIWRCWPWRLWWCCQKTRNSCSHQELEEAKNRQTPSQREHSPSDILIFGTVILFWLVASRINLWCWSYLVCNSLLPKMVDVALQGRDWKDFEAHGRICLDYFWKTLGRNKDFKGFSG